MQCISPLHSSAAYLDSSSILNSAPNLQPTIALLKNNDPTLKELDLKDSNMDDDSLCALAAAIAQNQHLTKLDISENQLGPTATQALADALVPNTVLTKLSLARCELGSSGMRILMQSISFNAGLTELDISGNKIEKEGVRHLSVALILNEKIKSLDLSGNILADRDVQMLVHALQKNGSLIELNLEACTDLSDPISDDTIFDLTHTLDRNFLLRGAALPKTIQEAYDEGMKHYAASNYLLAYTHLLQATLLPSNDQETAFMETLTRNFRFGFNHRYALEAIKIADKLAATGFEHLQGNRYLKAQASFAQALSSCRDHAGALRGMEAVQNILPISEWYKPSATCTACNLV